MKKNEEITSFRQYRELFFPKSPDGEVEMDPYLVGQQLAQKVLGEADLSAITARGSTGKKSRGTSKRSSEAR